MGTRARREASPVDLDGVIKITFNYRGQNVLLLLCLELGNPHAVIFVDEVEGFDVRRSGAGLRRTGFFPKRIHVEFVRS